MGVNMVAGVGINLIEFFSYAGGEFNDTNRFAAQAEVGCAVKHVAETANVCRRQAFAHVACAVAEEKGMTQLSAAARDVIDTAQSDVLPQTVQQVTSLIIEELKGFGCKAEADALHKYSINNGLRQARGWR